MRNFVMYVDESGMASLTHPGRYFVLSGIVVEDYVDSELSAYLRYLKRRYSIDEATSLHAYDMFENKHDTLYITETDRCKKFAASIAEFVENAPFKVLVFYIDKEELKAELKLPKGYSFKGSRDHKADREVAYEILARKLVFEFAKILKKEKAIGSVIAESRNSADTTLLGAYLDAHDINKYQTKPKTQKLAGLAREYVHSICFASKKSLKGALELVDIISYCAFNELVGKYSSQRNDRRGIKPMWTRIKKRIGEDRPVQVSGSMIRGLAQDRIHKISERVEQRIAQYRDLVNPTG